MFFTNSSFTTPRGETGGEYAPSAQSTPGGTANLAGCRGPDAHAENRRLQRDIEGMRERLQAMGMCCGNSATLGGPHPTPQEQSAVGSAAPSPAKPAHPFRRGPEGQGKATGAPKAIPPSLNVENSSSPAVKEAGGDTEVAPITKLRPMPSKSSGKENVPQPTRLRSQVCDESLPQDNLSDDACSGCTQPASGTCRDKAPMISDAKNVAGPSLFAVMRTAATVKAAERADGAVVTDAAQVYQVAAAALAASPEMSSSRGTNSLKDEREKLKEKVDTCFDDKM